VKRLLCWLLPVAVLGGIFGGAVQVLQPPAFAAFMIGMVWGACAAAVGSLAGGVS